MTPGALAFMAVSWLLVLGLAGWSFVRVLTAPRRAGGEPDGSGRGTSSTVRPSE